MCIANFKAPKYIKQLLITLKGEINMAIVGDFTVDRSSRNKINKEVIDSNNSTDQEDLKNICGIFHATVVKYTFFQLCTEHSPR